VGKVPIFESAIVSYKVEAKEYSGSNGSVNSFTGGAGFD
jgi:hypothetical protein